MTLHAAKGLEFETVFLPGWEEGLFPSQRTLDEKGTAGLEEERRLAYVGITRAKERARVSFAANRRVHGQLAIGACRRALSAELPAAHVENVADENIVWRLWRLSRQSPAAISAAPMTAPAGGARRRAWSQSVWRFARPVFRKPRTQIWRRRAQRGRIIEAEAKVVQPAMPAANIKAGERVFHQKFGYGRVMAVDGNKLEVEFDKAGTKRVIDNFVSRAS